MKYPLILLSVLILSSCELFIGPNLPPITEEGRNTFGCMVGDSIFLPKNSFLLNQDPLKVQYSADDSVLYISAQDYDEYIRIELQKCCDTKKYLLVNYFTEKSLANYSNSDLKCYYETDSTETGNFGVLEISKFDLDSQIVSGTFEFTAVSDDCGTINVSEGRFDLYLRK